MRRRSWTPLLPKELLAFAASSGQRLVQHGAQLLDIHQQLPTFGMGGHTDIHVDAILQLPGGKYGRLSAIVEVKGCWNKYLMTAMQTQLRDRYLRDNACPFGLYLVGWFTCPQWDPKDYRRHVTPKLTLDEARARDEARASLQLQAETLSSDEVHLKAFVLHAALP
jgi:hypothetical protein